MSEENKEIVRRWFEEVWNKGHADTIDELFAENGIAHGLSDASLVSLTQRATQRSDPRTPRVVREENWPTTQMLPTPQPHR